MSLLPSLLFAIASAWPGDVAVQVVNAKRQPVAGAWVAAFVATGAGFRAGEFWRDGSDEPGIDAIQQWLERGATGEPSELPEWVATDAQGRATVRPPSFWNDFVAVTPAASGHAIFVRGSAAKGDVVEIAVKPNRFLHVPVVDGVDPKVKPVVDVEFGTEVDLRARDSFRRITSRPTAGAENVATLGPIDLLFDPLQADPTIVARLDLPIDPAPRLRVRASQLETKANPITPLLVPPHGTIEVHVVDRDGKPRTGPGFLVLRRDPTGGSPFSKSTRIFSRSWQNSDLGSWRRALTGGVARFEFVGLGAELALGDEQGGFWPRSNPPDSLDIRGPVAPLLRAGEVRTLELLDPDPPSRVVGLRGRLVDDAGRPETRRQLTLELCLLHRPDGDDANGPWKVWGDLKIAPDGGFSTSLDLPDAAKGDALLIVADTGPLGRSDCGPVAAKSVEIQKIEEWGGGELGTVVLESLPLLVRGRAVDEEGGPIAALGVSLRFDDSKPVDASVPRWWTIYGDGSASVTEPDGSFELRGFGRERRWQIQAGNDEFSGRQAVELGPDPAEIVLRCERGRSEFQKEPFGQISGSLLLDPEVPLGAVDVRIHVHSAAPDGTQSLNNNCFALEPGDRFGCLGAPVGSWEVTATLNEFPEPPSDLAVVQDVKIERGRLTTLAPIDLRGRIHVKRLAIRDRGGAPVVGGFMLLHERPKPGPRYYMDNAWFHDGDAVLCATGEWPDIDFVAEGFRRVTHRFDDSPSETIVLPPALLVQAVLPEELQRLPEPLTLEIEMHVDDNSLEARCDGGSNPPEGDKVTFTEGHIAELHLPAAARYWMMLSVHRSRPGRESRSDWSYLPVRHGINVPDSDAPIRIDVKVTQAEIDEAMKQFGF